MITILSHLVYLWLTLKLSGSIISVPTVGRDSAAIGGNTSHNTAYMSTLKAAAPLSVTDCHNQQLVTD